MKVLLIATNRAERYMARMAVRPLPIGLAYIAAHVDEERHELRVLDLMFTSDPIGDVAEAVTEFGPDVVGLSIRNLDNQSYLDPVWHLPAIKEIIDQVREKAEATIVCGGPGFSILPAECLEYLGGDIGIAGDAARSISQLFERLESGQDYTGIPGVVYRDGDRIISNEAEFPDSFQVAPRLDLLDIERYDRAGFGIGVVTKLAQFYYQTDDRRDLAEGEGWRIRPIDAVLDEIESLNRRFGVNKIFFIDSGFNVPIEPAKALCEALASFDTKIRWNSYLRPGECDGELVSQMKRSGCSLALMAGGIDCGSDERADITDELAEIGVIAELCREAALPISLALSFGGPGETNASIERKLGFLAQIEPAFASLRVGVRIIPNTSIASLALEQGLIASHADLIKPVFYIDPGVKDGLADRLRTEAEAHPRWNLS